MSSRNGSYMKVKVKERNQRKCRVLIRSKVAASPSSCLFWGGGDFGCSKFWMEVDEMGVLKIRSREL
jgi:hypothetical protein